MGAPLRLEDESLDTLGEFTRSLQDRGLTAWRTTVGAARTFTGRVQRSGGWDQVPLDTQLEWMRRARPFVSWLLLTGRITPTVDFVALADLRLGVTARRLLPDAHADFTRAACVLGASAADTAIQWNALCKVAVLFGVTPDLVTEAMFHDTRRSLDEAYRLRGLPESGRNLRAVFHRLQLTLFHEGRVDTLARPMTREPVTVSGWQPVAPSYRQAALRYVDQVRLSLRPSTVKHIEQHLRVFGRWLAQAHPEVTSCADLTRDHIEEFKAWLATSISPRTGKPLARTSIKEQLINLSCFFDRAAAWGYPDAPTRPLLYGADLPRVDRPLPRFLDDAAAAKLARATRAEPDPLARLCIEILARTGIRLSELLALTVDAVVTIGATHWLRIPVGKLHNDRYIPLHPDLKTLIEEWQQHRPPGLRSDLLLVEHGRPVTKLRVSRALARVAEEAGIGHVTPHQLRHTLATQAINRGMSLEAIAALLGHHDLSMTTVYARIADRVVADEYFTVTEKVEILYAARQPAVLPADAAGPAMQALRAEADAKGQTGRRAVYDALLKASPTPPFDTDHPHKLRWS